MDFNVAELLGRTRLEARPYQQRVIAKSVDAYLGRGLRSVLIESPTGSGKTSMGLCIVKAMQDANPDLEVGWFSMRRNLLTQAEKENVEKAIGARVRFISMFDKNLPEELLVGNGRTAARRMLVVDEAQHDAANTMASIHARVQPNFILGMTATPFRTDCVKLCFDVTIKDAGLASLIQDGYLAKFNHYTIPNWSVRDVTDSYLREPQKWGKSIFYWHTVDQCAQAARILEDAGVGVETVTGGHPSAREAQIDRFKAGAANGGVDVIMNCMVLTEGFDCVSTDTEVLTETGWKNVTAVSETENCYSLNRETGMMELTPVLASAGRPVRSDEQMMTLKSQHLDLRTTEGHEFHVKYRDPNKKGTREERLSNNWLTLTGAALSARRSEFHLPLAAPLAEGFPGVNSSDDEVASSRGT